MPFVKLDCGILNSSLWIDQEARTIFITALLMAVPFDTEEPMPEIKTGALEETGWSVPPGWYGMVEAASSGIILRAGLEKSHGQEALIRLSQPDPESRSDDFEGRRLVRVDGGYIVLNYFKYRERDYTAAARAARYRAKKASHAVTSHRHAVTSHRHAVTSRNVTHAEAEAEAEAITPLPNGAVAPRAKGWKAPSREEVHIQCQKAGLPDTEEEKLWNHYMSNGWKVGKVRMTSLPHAVGGWAARWREAGNPRPVNGARANGRVHRELTEQETLAIARGEMRDPNYE